MKDKHILCGILASLCVVIAGIGAAIYEGHHMDDAIKPQQAVFDLREHAK